LRRTAMLAVAAAAVLAAILILVFTGGQRHARTGAARVGAGGPTDVQVAAAYLGSTPRQVRRRLRAGETLGQLAEAGKGTSRAGLLTALQRARAAAVKQRRLPAAQERTELAALRAELELELSRVRGRRPGELAIATRYLGITPAALTAALRAGSSLADLAQRTAGRSRGGLIAAIMAPRRARLEAAARSHQITTAEERAAIGLLRARVAGDVERRRATPGG
jgi:hypothetical protein